MRVHKEVMGTDNLPWEYDAGTGCIDGRLRYVCDTGKKGAPVVLMNEDDAALAVHCVNNFTEVVETLEALCYDYHLATGGEHHDKGLEVLRRVKGS